MEVINIMDMNHSYKPVFIKSFFSCVDRNGRASIDSVVDSFISFYKSREESGFLVEKSDSILYSILSILFRILSDTKGILSILSYANELILKFN